MRGLDASLLDSLCDYSRTIIHKGYGRRPDVLADRQKLRGPRFALGAGCDAMASPYHPFHFAELFFAEELEDLLDDAHAKAHALAQLDQGHFTTEIQRLQRNVLKKSTADSGVLDFVGRNTRDILHLAPPTSCVAHGTRCRFP